MRPAELRAYSALVAACLLGWALLFGFLVGPGLEAALFPVRTDQAIARVERVEDRLCWDWSSRKLRAAATDDLDVFLVVEGERYVVGLVGARNGLPWRKSAAAPVGPFVKRYCTTLPPQVLPGQAVRLEQTLWYRGFLGLWRVPLRVPDVVDAGPAR